jgi:cation diffusion facilitator CzcD-associated flavoprotein CzcO
MPYRVVVIGAGFGGIGMAIALKQAGIEDFVVVDRADDLGGTWRDNSYPGLTCDVPSHLYSFSFRPWRWSRRFPAPDHTFLYRYRVRRFDLAAYRVMPKRPATAGTSAA